MRFKPVPQTSSAVGGERLQAQHPEGWLRPRPLLAGLCPAPSVCSHWLWQPLAAALGGMNPALQLVMRLFRGTGVVFKERAGSHGVAELPTSTIKTKQGCD